MGQTEDVAEGPRNGVYLGRSAGTQKRFATFKTEYRLSRKNYFRSRRCQRSGRVRSSGQRQTESRRRSPHRSCGGKCAPSTGSSRPASPVETLSHQKLGSAARATAAGTSGKLSNLLAG